MHPAARSSSRLGQRVSWLKAVWVGMPAGPALLELDDVAIDYGWGGTLSVTVNRLPHVGRLKPNLFFAQGFSGHGISTGTFAGKVLAEAVGGVVVF